ncbi:hypothetical protein FHU30_005469 [Actinomadura rupiterrae]|nr:hypothetical protein [Actinomadura rupiterrae]
MFASPQWTGTGRSGHAEVSSLMVPKGVSWA